MQSFQARLLFQQILKLVGYAKTIRAGIFSGSAWCINEEIDYSIASTDSSQQALLSIQYASANNIQSFLASACVPSSTICLHPYGLSSSVVHSLAVKVHVSSTTSV